ncbi:MAG: hypothetical protein IJF83_09355 [Methanobrevibacter sp.]|nr:hypothetical protein [Methanobrevibacter sp.]
MNLKKKVFIFAMVICMFLTISSAVAGDVNDTQISVSENPSNDGIINSCDDNLISASSSGNFTELQNIINAAKTGDTITLERDYTYNGDFNSPRGIIFIANNLTIDGNGHTLNGLSKSRILFILPGLAANKITLKNITFKNGYTDSYGGSILNMADLTITNCVFEKSYANIAGGAICSIGSLNCKNSNFNKNSANGSAGAIFSLNFEGSLQYFNINLNVSNINEIKIIKNILDNYEIKPMTDYITKCKFTNNFATAHGGAVYAYSHINIDSSTFSSNKVNQWGGAVFAAKNLVIKNSKFTKNSASIYGGAVFFKFHEITGYYDNQGTWQSDVKFYSNLIENCVFTENVAKSRGGAIYGLKSLQKPNVSPKLAVKCTFSDNKAPEGKDVYGGTVSNCVYKNTKLTLNTVKVKKSAKKLTLTATLKKGSSPLVNKYVTFKFKGKVYKAKTNSKGVAKATVKSNVLKNLKIGSKVTYQASYASFSVKKTAKVYR